MCSFCVHAQQPTENSVALIKQAVNLYENDKYKEAIAVYNKIPRGDTNYLSVLTGLTYTYYADSNFAQSQKMAEQGLKLYPEKADEWYNMIANNLDNLGKQQEALLWYDKYIKHYNNAYLAYFNKGITYYKQKQMADAKKNFQQCILINPYYAKAHYHLGNIAFEEGNMVAAMLSYATNLIVDPENKLSNSSIKAMAAIAKGSDEVSKKAAAYKPGNGDNYEEIQEILLSKIALDEGYKLKTDLEDPVVRQLQMIFEKIKFAATDNSFWMQYYVPLFETVLKENQFEPLMYFMFSNVDLPDIQKYVKRNKKKMEDIVGWYAPYLNEIRATQELIVSKRKGITERVFYSDGLPWGKGKLTGEGKNQVITGPWEFYYDNGQLKSKGVLNDKQEKIGEWVFYYLNGQLSEKSFYKEGKVDGKNISWYDNGTIMSESNYKEGELNGKETNYYFNGIVKSVADYKEGLKDGNFISQTTYNNLNYKGTYKDDKEEGTFNYFYPSGNMAATISYKKGEPDGVYKKVFEDGTPKLEGNATAGKYTGLLKEYHNNGKLKSSYNYIDGELSGDFKEFHYNGQPMTVATYVNGKIEGKYQDFDVDGKVFSESLYEKGRLRDLKFFDKTGNIISSSTSRNGSGNLVFFDPQGYKTSEGYFTKEGYRNGKTTFYFRNGKIKTVAQYKDGLLNGEKISYYYNGNIAAKNEYKDDEEDGYQITYYINGNKEHEGEVRKGSNEGLHIDYNYMGQVFSKSDYKNGVLDGYVAYYHPNGKIDYESRFTSGWIVAITQYDTSGKAISETDFPQGNGTFNYNNYSGSSHIISTYKNHYLHGEQTNMYLNQTPAYKQYYKYGIKDSTVRGYYLNGKLQLEGQYKMGEKDGKWTYFHENGKLNFSEIYKMGKLNGLVKKYNEDGTLDKELNYTNGELDGELTIYGDNNNLALVLNYSYGLFTGYSYEDNSGKLVPSIPLKGGTGKVVAYYKNGTKSVEFDIEEDEGNGKRNIFSSSGKPFVEGNSVLGYDHGIKKFYYSNGQLAKEENYFFGNLNGTVKSWSENGKLISEEQYYNGERHGTKKIYDITGKLSQTLTYYYGVLLSIK